MWVSVLLKGFPFGYKHVLREISRTVGQSRRQSGPGPSPSARSHSQGLSQAEHMRPQARQFSVEIKSRKRPTSPAISASAAARQDDWVDLIPPDDVPERDVHEDLAGTSVPSEARREAERLFGRLGDAQPVETRKDAAAPFQPQPAPAPARVLPDLLAETREQERQKVEKPERTRAAKTPRAKRPR